MMAASAGDSELVTELQLAIERGELSLLFQLKVEIATNKLVGVEALSRWPHRTRGLIEPKTFIPLAERFGMIDELTDWVVRRSLKQWVAWKEQGLKTNIAFNVSALSLPVRVDTVKPTIKVTKLERDGQTIRVSGVATDDQRVAQVIVDGIRLNITPGTRVEFYAETTGTYADIQVRDTAGNTVKMRAQ